MIKKMLLTLLSSFLLSSAHAANSAPLRIKWLVAHNPTNKELNKMISEAGKKIEKESKGSMAIDFVFYDNTVRNRHVNAINEVFGNFAQLAQVELASLDRYTNDIDVFNMPYLLENHAHVKKVISGPIGNSIKEKIIKGSDNRIVPMAYTYSGGFRMFYGVKQLTKLSDFTGLRTTNQGIAPLLNYHKLIGLDTSIGGASREETVGLYEKKKIDIEDSELNRLYVLAQDYPNHLKNVKYLTETKHLFYLTMIISNNEFMNKLDKNQAKIVNSVIQKLAEDERVYSIKQEAEARKYLKDKGLVFVDMKEADKKEFIKKSRELWKTYPLIADLITNIRKLNPTKYYND